MARDCLSASSVPQLPLVFGGERVCLTKRDVVFSSVFRSNSYFCHFCPPILFHGAEPTAERTNEAGTGDEYGPCPVFVWPAGEPICCHAILHFRRVLP